jgi:hypothetical protein
MHHSTLVLVHSKWTSVPVKLNHHNESQRDISSQTNGATRLWVISHEVDLSVTDINPAVAATVRAWPTAWTHSSCCSSSTWRHHDSSGVEVALIHQDWTFHYLRKLDTLLFSQVFDNRQSGFKHKFYLTASALVVESQPDKFAAICARRSLSVIQRARKWYKLL